MKETLALSVGVVVLLWVGWRLLARYVHKTPGNDVISLMPEALLKPKPLLEKEELHLYNLIRMAVQDHYLVLAHVPLWSFVEVGAEGKTRWSVLRYLALKTVDFALVHPGSREVQHIVLLTENEKGHVEGAQRHHEIQKVMESAGIRATILSVRSRYTVERLAQILGVDETEL